MQCSLHLFKKGLLPVGSLTSFKSNLGELLSEVQIPVVHTQTRDVIGIEFYRLSVIHHSGVDIADISVIRYIIF